MKKPREVLKASIGNLIYNKVSVLLPKAIITIYDNDKNQQSYMEVYNVDSDKKLSSPKPLSVNAMKKIFKAMVSKKDINVVTEKPILNQRLIYVDQSDLDCVIAWIMDAGIYKITIKEKQKETFHVALPSMLFIGNSEKFKCYFLNTNKVTLKSNVFKALLPNVYNNSSICTGMNKLYSNTKIDVYINRAIDIFFNAGFTNNDMIQSDLVKSPYDFLLHLGHLKEYPADKFEHFKNKMTIDDAIQTFYK